MLKDLIICLDKKKKKRSNLPTTTCLMVSCGSFDQIIVTKEEQTFPLTYNASKSLVDVAEFGLQLPKEAILMEFEVDKEVNITYIYIGMKKPHTPYRPTFYEIMTNDLDVLEL